MAPCCTRWHALIYFTMAVTLAVIAISTTLHSEPNNNETSQSKPISHFVSLSASRTLRRSGFNAFATLLQLAPELFFSTENSTLFAIKDSAISKTSLPPRLLKNLLQYHTVPLSLPVEHLLKMPHGTRLPTLYRNKNVAITKVDEKKRLVEINHVLVSHPNLFLEGSISIHGVLAPFSGWDSIQSSSYVPADLKNTVEWSRIIRFLSSNGYISFAIELHHVLDGILGDDKSLKFVTIFVPPRLELEAYPSTLLERVVRFHILPQRFTSSELKSLPARTLLRTLLHGQPVEVTGGMDFVQGLFINGVKIVAPDVFSSTNFIVHGISRALELDDMPSTAR